MDAVRRGNKYFSDFIHLEFCCEMGFQQCFAFSQRPIKNIHKSSFRARRRCCSVVPYRPRSSIAGVQWRALIRERSVEEATNVFTSDLMHLWRDLNQQIDWSHARLLWLFSLLFFLFHFSFTLTFWKVLPCIWLANTASGAALTYTGLCPTLHTNPPNTPRWFGGIF